MKALFFDIDGTLVSFKTHKIPQTAIDALLKAKKNGIKIFISTGRSILQVDELANIPFDGYITQNGAYCCTSDKKIIFRKAFPREINVAMANFIEKRESFPCLFMSEERVILNYIDQTVELLSKLTDITFADIMPLKKMVQRDVLQYCAFVDEKLEKKLMEEVFSDCIATRWNPYFVDINQSGLDKGTGIDRVLEYYNIPLSESMAFGDGGNDISMISHAAVGVAMGNAKDNVKEVADYITDTVDNDGIAKALKLFL